MRRRGLVAHVAAFTLALFAFAAAAAADPAVWRVDGARGAELWLLGSVHVLRREDHPLPEGVDRLFARADEIVMELDLDDLDPDEQQRILVGKAMLPPGTTLRDVLPAATYATAEAQTRALGIDLAQLQRFEPWLVAIMLLDLGLQSHGYRGELGVEQYLLGKARSAGKAITGLESLEQQLALFDGLSPGAQRDLLAQTLGELATAGMRMGEITAAWRDGRLEALGTALLEEFEQFPGLYENIVADRNASWIAPLEALLAGERKVLVVVGALHLVGPDSVVAKLAARGHEVRRVERVP